MQLGATYAKMENHANALEAYSRATALKPNFARGWLNTGLSQYKLKHSAEAAKCMQSRHVRLLRTVLAYSSPHFVCLAGYLRALRIAPSASHVWSLLRIAFGQMDRYDLVARTEACNPEVFSAELGL
jgi:tetratricopeptide (TPR) repeat protein